MGTRGAMGFRLDGKDHIFYNAYDSYPDGLGRDVLDALQRRVQVVGTEGLVGELKQQVRSLIPVDTSTLPTAEQKRWCKVLGLVNLEVGTRSENDLYCLLHATQGRIEKALEARFYQPNEDFLDHGLYCEFAYIIDLDDEIFEFYVGSAEHAGKPPLGRYWAALSAERQTALLDANEHGPVALRWTAPLTEVLSSSTDSLVSQMAGK